MMVVAILLGVFALNLAGYVEHTTLNIVGRYTCFAIAAIGIDIIWGFTGILSLCQAFFFCIGGYCIGMHMLLMTGEEGKYGSKLPDFMVWLGTVKELPWFWEFFHSFPATLFLSVFIPASMAAILGFFIFRSRVKGVYFAIITQALALAMWYIFLRNETMLGGTNGLTDFKTLLGFPLQPDADHPEAAINTKRALYLVSVFMLVVAFCASRWIMGTKFGKVLVAIRDSEQRVRFTGYPVEDYKLAVFIFAAALAGLAGLLYVPQTGIITPGKMAVRSSIEMVVWVAVGGRATLVGPVIGALLVNLMYSQLTGSFPGSWLYFLGFLFVGVVLLLPGGITSLIDRIPGFGKSKEAQA